jgi:hypothetical protein
MFSKCFVSVFGVVFGTCGRMRPLAIIDYLGQMTACARPLAISACARLLAIIDQVKVIEPTVYRARLHCCLVSLARSYSAQWLFNYMQPFRSYILDHYLLTIIAYHYLYTPLLVTVLSLERDVVILLPATRRQRSVKLP